MRDILFLLNGSDHSMEVIPSSNHDGKWCIIEDWYQYDDDGNMLSAPMSEKVVKDNLTLEEAEQFLIDTQKKDNNWIWYEDFYNYHPTKTESSNKYIKSFREAVEKLEEDDGNPSLLQAMNYNIDNDEMEYDDRFKDLGEHIFDVYDEAYNLYHRDYNDNKKVEKVVNLLHTAWRYLLAEHRYKDLYRNKFVNKPYYDDEPDYDLQNADYDYQNK